MTIDIKSWFRDGVLYHTMDWLIDRHAYFTELMQGRTIKWTGLADDATPPGWSRTDLVEVAFPTFWTSSIYATPPI